MRQNTKASPLMPARASIMRCRYSAASLFAMRYLTCAREVSRIPPRISRCSKRAAHPGFNLPGAARERPRAPLVPMQRISSRSRDILETIGLEDVEHPVALVQAPMEHHGGHSWLLSCLSAGAAVVVASKFDAEEILGKIERYAVTHIILLPPSVYCRLSREAAPALATCLRCVLCRARPAP